jgi:hypothetical protein
MASLRTLLNIETADDLVGAAGAVPGKTWIAQVTCQQCQFDSYSDWCCNSFIIPTGTREIILDVWGGGGGGGRSRCCGSGPPGGSGAWGRKCMNTNDFSAGECIAVMVARSTYCSQDNTGCNGNWSCACLVGRNTIKVCSQGGGYGCWYCQPGCCDVNAYCTCERERCSYCADIWSKGHVGCTWYRCRDDSCFNKVGIPYPGGLHNRCGGVVWVNECCHYSYGAWMNEYASHYVTSPVGTGYCCNGYLPGMGGATQSTNRGVCRCGSPGAAGMIRVTYR